MAFPEVNRVLYEKNPLEEVICQLRFPPILKIETDIPAAFQERIRVQYPLYTTKGVGIPGGLPESIAQFLPVEFPFFPTGKAHEFASQDNKWKVSLTKEFMALSCGQYQRWEVFKEHLREPLLALEELYKPSFCTRLGLRYRDVIRRSVLGLEKVEWSELLQPWIIGLLAKSEIAGEIPEMASEFLARLPDNGAVRLRHGLALDDSSKEQCYLIDADYFNETQTEIPRALEKLDYLNRQSRFLFRWCIKERLHQAMGPQPIGPP